MRRQIEGSRAIAETVAEPGADHARHHPAYEHDLWLSHPAHDDAPEISG